MSVECFAQPVERGEKEARVDVARGGLAAPSSPEELPKVVLPDVIDVDTFGVPCPRNAEELGCGVSQLAAIGGETITDLLANAALDDVGSWAGAEAAAFGNLRVLPGVDQLGEDGGVGDVACLSQVSGSTTDWLPHAGCWVTS